MKRRVHVIHGVNFDVLERRDPALYGGQSLIDLELQIGRYAEELDLDASFSQTNHEGEFCEELHVAPERADGLILNPGAWTHYSYAIRDALELTGLPAVEMHLSAVSQRDDFRRVSVLQDLCIGVVEGRGAEGYRDGLALLKERFQSDA